VGAYHDRSRVVFERAVQTVSDSDSSPSAHRLPTA
jgi:hypothetical protein